MKKACSGPRVSCTHVAHARTSARRATCSRAPGTSRPSSARKTSRRSARRSTEKEEEMIGYVMLGTNDFPRAARFYDGLCVALGAKRFLENEREIVWMRPEGGSALSVVKPYDGNPATVGNGVMVALRMGSPAEV